MHYKYIINPRTNKKISIKSKLGKQILLNYLNNYLNKNLYGGKIEVSDMDPTNFIAKLAGLQNHLNKHAEYYMIERDMAHDFGKVDDTTIDKHYGSYPGSMSEADMTYEYIKQDVGMAHVEKLYYIDQKIKFKNASGDTHTECLVDGYGTCKFIEKPQVEKKKKAEGSLPTDLEDGGFMYYDAGMHSVFHKDNTTWANLFDPATKANLVENLPPIYNKQGTDNKYSKITTDINDLDQEYINARWQQLLIFIWYSKVGGDDVAHGHAAPVWPKFGRDANNIIGFEPILKKYYFYNKDNKHKSAHHYKYFFIAINILRSLDITLEKDGAKLIAKAGWTQNKPNDMQIAYNNAFENPFLPYKITLFTANESFELPISRSDTYTTIISKTKYYKKDAIPSEFTNAPSIKKKNLDKIFQKIVKLLDKTINESDQGKTFVYMYIGLLLKLLGDTSFILALLYDKDAFLRTFDNFLAMRAFMYNGKVLAECYPTSHVFKLFSSALPPFINADVNDYAFFYSLKSSLNLRELTEKIIEFIDFDSKEKLTEEILYRKFTEKLKDESGDTYSNVDKSINQMIYKIILENDYIIMLKKQKKAYGQESPNVVNFKSNLSRLRDEAANFFCVYFKKMLEKTPLEIQQLGDTQADDEWMELYKKVQKPREELLSLIKILDFINEKYNKNKKISIDLDTHFIPDAGNVALPEHGCCTTPEGDVRYIDRIFENFIFSLIRLYNINGPFFISGQETVAIRVELGYKIGCDQGDFVDIIEKRHKKISNNNDNMVENTYKLYQEIGLYLNFFDNLQKYQLEDFIYLVKIIKNCYFLRTDEGMGVKRLRYYNSKMISPARQDTLQLGPTPKKTKINDFLICVSELLKFALGATGGYIIMSSTFKKHFTDLKEKYDKFMVILKNTTLPQVGASLREHKEASDLIVLRNTNVNNIKYKIEITIDDILNDNELNYNFSTTNIIYIFLNFLRSKNISLNNDTLDKIISGNIFLPAFFNTSWSTDLILSLLIILDVPEQIHIYINFIFNIYFVAYCKETHCFNDFIYEPIDLRNKYFRILLNFINAIVYIQNNLQDYDNDYLENITNLERLSIERFKKKFYYSRFFYNLHQTILDMFRYNMYDFTQIALYNDDCWWGAANAHIKHQEERQARRKINEDRRAASKDLITETRQNKLGMGEQAARMKDAQKGRFARLMEIGHVARSTFFNFARGRNQQNEESSSPRQLQRESSFEASQQATQSMSED